MFFLDLVIFILIVASGVIAFISLEKSKTIARARYDASLYKRKYIDELLLSRYM